MRNKRTKILLILLALVLIVALFAMVACQNEPDEEEEDKPIPDDGKKQGLEFSQYMNKINTGLTTGEGRLQSLKDYHVSSEAELYTSEENLTVYYEAVYRENRRLGKYYIRIFDNDKHVERLNAYYDGADLYVTVRDMHYVIRDFGTLLVFGAFDACLDVLDIGDLVYGATMQEYFNEVTLLSQVLTKEDFTYARAGEHGESISLHGDASLLLGFINATITAFTEQVGTTFDAVSDHYLGFQLSRLIKMELGSINMEELRFNLSSGMLTGTSALVNGRMRDNTKYFLKGAYAFDETTDEIASAKELPKAYVYTPVSPEHASFEGDATFPDIREGSPFDIALDYDVNPKNNAENRATLRIFDQLATDDEFSQTSKYANIKELVSGYYRDELTYVNTEGLYAYINTAVALAALRLPKIYFSGVNMSGLLTLAYSDLLQAFKVIVSPKERDESTTNKRLYEHIMSAIESDVEKKTISFTLTEDLIKEIRGDNTPLAVLLGDMVGVDGETVMKYVGDDFFELMRVVLTYNFGNHTVYIDVYRGTELLADVNMVRTDYYGIVYPNDLNDLTYAEFKEPDVVTVTYRINANPYGAQSVDLSGFIGAFVGDSTGKNTPFTMSTGQSVSAEGQMSEYYITNYNNEREAVTSLMMELYLVNANRKTRTLVMELATDPINNGNFLVVLYTQIGDYDATATPVRYTIPRQTVSDELDKLQGEDSIFSGTTGLSAFLQIYGAVDKNARTYSGEGFFGINLMVSDTNDPVRKLTGISDTNATVQAKITFDVLDLSGLNVNEYSDPYVHTVDDVATTSIYSAGSKWKETAPVTVDGRRINMYTTYEEDSVRIETGKTDYNPVAYIFGKPFSYALHVVNVAGTYKIKSIVDVDENDVMVIDPAYYSAVPTTITVMFEGGEEGELPCEIKGFPDARITADGFNLSLLAGFKDGVESNRLVIGRDSIATMEKDIYVAVINRQVIAQKQTSGLDDVYVNGNEQVPVVAEFVADPYTYAMKARIAAQSGDAYDYLAEQLENEKIQIHFYNVYGTEEVEKDDGEIEIRELVYDKDGYNWFYLSDMPLRWEFSDKAFSWSGEVRYAVATYGTAENENNLVRFAVRVNVTSKIVEGVRIDDYATGTYLIDVLNESTYNIPTTTGDGHTVRILFTDKTSRIVSLSRSALLSEDEYCAQYAYGQLSWQGTAGLSSRLNLAGSRGLFGSNESASNNTTAAFGGELSNATQTVHLSVVAPSRVLESEDYETDYLVTRIESNLMMTGNQASVVKTARFTAPTTTLPTTVDELTADTYNINPYNRSVVLPSTIWLYVRMEDGTDARREWVEYPVRWTTTDASRNELNIVKTNQEGKYVLAHPVTRETKLIVYGQVGTSTRSIWVAMRLLNMASDIRSYVLYLPSGVAYYDTSSGESERSVAIDPYLSYSSVLPSRFVATLGSGLTVEGETDWYYGEYPLIRANNDEYMRSAYDGYYREDGYYMFSKEGSSGGTFSLKMVVAQGEVSNDIYLQASVSARHILTDADTSSCVLDVVNVSDGAGGYAYSDGERYDGVGSAGYTEVNYYDAFSTTLLNSLQRYYDAGGVGVAGFAIRELANEDVLYAKTVKWNVAGLARIISALKKEISDRTFALSGVVDEGTRNQTTVTMSVTINRQKANLSSIGLTLSQDMINKEVYSVENDLNADRAITVASEASKSYMTNVTFYRNVQYKKFFALEEGAEGYTDSTYAGFIYFAIDKTYMLSKYSAGAYTSPYEYFKYLFGSVKLVFDSDADETANAAGNMTLLDRTPDFFNASVLGLEPSTLETDARGTARSYSFFILEKLSAGSAIDRYLVIVSAEKATAESLVRQDVVDALGSDLSELYPDKYNLPTVVEVSYAKTDKSGAYKAKFAVESWTPTVRSQNALGTEPMTYIPAEYIDVISGSEYELAFTLPDSASAPVTAREFTLTVNFLQKDVNKTNYSAQAAITLYDVNGGVINVSNSYAFLVEDPNAASRAERFVIRTENVPTTIGVTDTIRYKTQKGSDVYEVTWRFEKTAFAEEIFRTGTQKTDESGNVSNPGERIATYTFNSYYHNGSRAIQTLELYVVLAPMEFYAIESDALTITNAPARVGDTSGNERKNTIEIDPYIMTGDKFSLPSNVTLLFNGTQRFTFSGVEYALVSAAGTVIPDSWLTSVPYGEEGHNLTEPDLDENRTVLKLAMFVRGYSQDSGSNGIPIYLHFLRHEIVSAAVPNAYYDEEGGYVYEKNGDAIVYDKYEPVLKTYTAYATCEDVRLPVYYIDPYNRLSYALPQTARFEFRSDPGVYNEYPIGGWQYYDVEYRTYIDVEYVAAGKTPSASSRFYSTGSTASGYYNPHASSYEGESFALRGYIKVGSDKQYFDVLCVVLTRKLRASVILEEEYTVTYDFTDPIAAMLADVPALLGADAFVDFDKYNEEITVSAIVNGRAGTYDFVIADADAYSQKQAGVATNHAVTPEILWDDEYEMDVDGDGETETVTFDDLTTIGFDGEIEGYLYRYDSYLNALIGYYTLKANAEYDRLVAALSWDTLFGEDGEPSTALSAGARTGIKSEYRAYRKEVLYATYRILTESQWTTEEIAAGTGLDSVNVQVLSSTLFEQVLRDLNVERTTGGLAALDRNDANDRIVVVNGIYEWLKAEAKDADPTSSEALIYAAWNKAVASYGTSDVTASKAISANQALKATHFNNLLATVNLFNAEEKKRLESQMEILRNNLYNNINADVYAYVYARANEEERALMDASALAWAIAGNEMLGVSLAFDAVKSAFKGETSLGAKGEHATADVNMPTITLQDMTVNGTTTPRSVRFNKFNFASIDKTFTVTFEISYEAIYARMLEEAEAEAIKSFRDDKKVASVEAFEQKSVEDAVDAVNPKLLNAEGGYDRLLNFTNSFGVVTSPFTYEKWANPTNTERDRFGGFWTTLYEYYREEAIKVVTYNVEYIRLRMNDGMTGYATLRTGFAASVEDLESVIEALRFIKVPLLAQELLAYLEKGLDLDSAAGRKAAIVAIANFVMAHEAATDTLYKAYVRVGLNGNYSMTDYVATDELLQRAENAFLNTVLPSIVDQKLLDILSGRDITLVEGTNTVDEPATEDKRREAIRAIANYLLETDVMLTELDEVYATTEDKYLAQLMKNMLSSEYAALSEAAANAIAQSGELTDDTTYGYAILFEQVYGDKVIGHVYTMLRQQMDWRHETVANVFNNEIEAKYADKQHRYAAVLYASLNSSNAQLNEIANSIFDFFVSYLNVDKTPYDLLLEREDLFTLTGLTKEQIERRKEEDGTLDENCLLANTQYTFEPIGGNWSVDYAGWATYWYGLTQSEMIELLKKRNVYEKLLSRATGSLNVPTSNKSIVSSMKDEARREKYLLGAQSLLEWADEATATSLRKVYDTTGTQANMNYYAFVEYVTRAEEAGREKGSRYEASVDEYVQAHRYESYLALVEALRDEYEEMIRYGAAASFTDDGLIAETFLKDYFESRGYETPEDYDDDYHDAAAQLIVAEDLVTTYNVGAADTTKVAESYLNDLLLRAIVMYYETVATDEQRTVVREILEMYVGSEMEDRLERALILAANRDRLTPSGGKTVGQNAFDNMKERDDLGAGATDDVIGCYYVVWLDEVLTCALIRVDTYDEAALRATEPYPTRRRGVLDVMTSLTGKSNESALSEQQVAVVNAIALSAARATVKTSLLNALQYETNFVANVATPLDTAAKKYAYDRMYETTTERGTYVYRSLLDDILEELVLSEATEMSRLVFETARDTRLGEETDVLMRAVRGSVRTVLFADAYDAITLFSVTPDEFARGAYKYLTGQNVPSNSDAAELLFGADKNGLGGIVGGAINECRENGYVDSNGQFGRYVAVAENWWLVDIGNTIYGVLGETERKFIAQINNQAYYQTKALLGEVSLGTEARKAVSCLTMLNTIYLFLEDMEKEIAKMPSDYFTAGNEQERKAYLVDAMLTGDLMTRAESRSMSLAKTTLFKTVTDAAREDARIVCSVASASVAFDQTATDYERFVEAVAYALVYAGGQYHPVTATDDERIQRSELFTKYYEKAVKYAEYTSVLGSPLYDATEEYPLRAYGDGVYRAVTGYDMAGNSAIGLEEARVDTFGVLSFGYFYKVVGNDYELAIEEMKKARTVYADDYVSEDFATEDDRHVVFFDRAEWEAFRNTDGTFAADAFYSDRNVFIGNPYKTEKGTDVSGGIGYENTLKLQGYEFRLSDFTTVDLFFETTAEDPYNVLLANVLHIDALNPALPETAYALGHATVNNVETEVPLGKVSITNYSSEFYKLVYNYREPTADDAYQVEIKAANGFTFRIINQVKVGYQDRSIRRVYLETDVYTQGQAVKQIEPGTDFNGLFDTYDPERGKNVIYIEPTDTSLILEEQRTYTMPGTLYLRCVSMDTREAVIFNSVTWDLSNVTYGLKGTGTNGKSIRVKSYAYVDDEGRTRTIEYDFANEKATMKVYDKTTGELLDMRTYEVKEEDAINWNMVLVVPDQSLDSVADIETQTIFGRVGEDGVVDATTIQLNPYYPDYPKDLQLNLKEGVETVSLTNEDWIPDNSMLRAIQSGNLQMEEDGGLHKFVASFYYLGYEIKVRFSAMDILVPMGEMLNGGVIYLVRGEGDVITQFKKHYGYMYYNFGDGEQDNWQKVPVALKRYGDVSMSANGVQRVEGIIGAEAIGTIDANAVFYVQVVDPKNYALTDAEYNKYVTYDYYSVPADSGSKANSVTDEPDVVNSVYIVPSEDGTDVPLRVRKDKFVYDFLNQKVTVTVEYDLTLSADARVGYDENGARTRTFSFTMPMQSYECKEIVTDGNHTNLSFDNDAAGKKWTWTTVPETNVNYVDAIYWPIGKALTASDLPKVYNRLTGESFSLLWDLNDLNVNRANVAVAGEVHEGDGVEIVGYYMTRGGWQNADPMRLTIYIEKYDITDAIVEMANEGSARINKTYDSQYFELPFNGDYERLSLLREDGTYATLGTEAYVVEYARVREDADLVWSATDYPLNAGEYYIRVRFLEQDYNTYIRLIDGEYLFRLTVNKCPVDLSKITFEDETYGMINRTYGASSGKLVVRSGLPAVTPANWFYPGEKVALYNEYFSQVGSQNLARAMAYAAIRSRVTESMKEIIDGWWKEGAAALRETIGFTSMSDTEQDVAIKAWAYENRFDPDLTIVEVKLKLTYSANGVVLDHVPSDCDNYNVAVTLADEGNDNYEATYATKNVTLSIEKDANINYAIANPIMTYNGSAQNPEITGLHVDGTLPYGVTVTYTYEIGDKYLVVVVRGDRDETGNTVNMVTIDASRTTVDNPLGGIRNAQQNNEAYRCSVDIKGGHNFIDGSISGVSVSIAKAVVFIDLKDVTAKYLSDVADLSDYVRVYDVAGIEQSEGKLLGTDRLADLGAIATYTEVGRHYKVGAYDTEIIGLRASDLTSFTYTKLGAMTADIRGKHYTILTLKPANEDGSLLKDEVANATMLELFNNYSIYVAGGEYTIEAEEGSEGLTGDDADELNQKFAQYIAALRDGDSKILYLPELLDGEGNVIAYDAVTINVAVNLTIVGYRRNAATEEEAEIITKLKGIRVLKGSVTLRILAFEGEQAGEAAIYVGEGANAVTLNNCAVTAKTGVASVVGLSTSVNYAQRISVIGTVFRGLSTAVDLLGGELSVTDSTFVRNYNGVLIHSTGEYISLRKSTFSNTTGKAISSTNGGVIIRDNVFEYNMITLDIPSAASVRADVNNNNVYTNNGDD